MPFTRFQITKFKKNTYGPYLFIVLVFTIFKLCVSSRYTAIAQDTMENCIFALLLILIRELFPQKRKQNAHFILQQAFIFILFIETTYFYLFDVAISASALFIFFETNPQEISEFITTKFDAKLGLLVVIYMLAASLLFYYSKQWYEELAFKKYYAVVSILGLIFLLKVSWLINHNFPYAFARAGYRYAKESFLTDTLSHHIADGRLRSVKDLYPNEPQVHVIIIGESTNRKHFSLYGQYYRNTTPKLESIRDELVVYNDVISPHSSTTASLIKVLTKNNYEKQYGTQNSSIIQLLNEAGYKTYWFSNQRPLDMWSTKVTKLAKASDSLKFFNSEHTSLATQHDQVLVEALKGFSLLKNDKLVIFLHLLGTHADYLNRYPKSFSTFKAPVANRTNRQSKFINEYDNAVVYNDHIVSEIINVAKKRQFSSVLYFSDHGEEIYDEINFHGHVADTEVDSKLTKNIFEIPFLIWRSEKMQNRKDLFFEPKRRYMTDDLFHSLAHLLGISAKEVDLKRSIFSHSFASKKRILGNNIEFDTQFE